jgi:hypothetical protein
MKVIITESKLEKVIYDFMDELFAAENGNTEIHKLESLSASEKLNEPIEGAYEFVNDDYYEHDQEYLFSWTGKEYYENHQRQSFGARLINEAPIVEILDYERIKKLDSYFGDIWKPVFKKWFENKVNLPIKTLYAQSS